jgi:hypothetical protein
MSEVVDGPAAGACADTPPAVSIRLKLASQANLDLEEFRPIISDLLVAQSHVCPLATL